MLLAYGKPLPVHVLRICSRIPVIIKYQNAWENIHSVRSTTIRAARDCLQNRERRYLHQARGLALEQERASARKRLEEAKVAEKQLTREWD